MKIFNRHIFTAAILATSFGMLTSCSDKDDYMPGGMVDGVQAYFPSTESTSYQLSANVNTFTIAVYRVNDSETVSVPVTVTASSTNTATDAFTFPGSVSFNAGEKKANILVEYNLDEISYDQSQSFTVKLDDTATTPYGASEVTISVVYLSPWTLLGTGKYTDTWDWVNDDGETTTVQFYQNGNDPNLFRITNPYEWYISVERPEYFEFRLLQPGDVFYNQTVPDLGITMVGYNDFPIEWNSNYDDDIYLVFPGRFTSLADPINWVFNYVTDWQDNGLPGEIHISPYYYMFNNGGWNYTTSEPISMIFPGFNPVDVSVAVTYNGMLHKADETLEAVAYVELGADVSEAKVAVVAGSFPSTEQLNGIEDGSIESVTISATSQVNLAFDEANPEGKYSVVAISYYEGESRSYDYATFTYTPATAETWSLVGTGLYTYLEFWEENLGLEPEVLELYESDATPGKFKITHWMNDQEFKFTVNADGTIYVAEEQPTGVTAGGAEIWVDDLTLWGEDQPGYLEDGVYHFSVIYYNSVSGGYYDYGYETFEPSTAGTASYTTRGSRLNSLKGRTTKLNIKTSFNSYLNKKGMKIETLVN